MSNFPHGAPHDEMTMSAYDQYAPAHYAEYPPPSPYPPPQAQGGGFTLEQAQWLIQFMRNLPGGAPPEPTEAEYAQALAAQRAQADSMPYAFEGASPYDESPYGYDE